MMDLARISAITNGQHSGANPVVSGLVNDTRKDCRDKLYVAIEGPNFDGHQYAEAAQAQGASGALLEKIIDAQIPFVQVDNSVQAMGQIATAWRQDFAIPVLGITGSAGKTTLKELAGSILSVSRQGIVTEGNLNNEIGVPLTLTRLTPEHEFAVVEMGMNHAGEIQRLSAMAAPTVAVINNAAPAHLDDLGSVEAVAKAKGEIIEGLAEDGVLIINADDDHYSLWQSLAGEKRTVSFGLTKKSDIYADYEFTAEGAVIYVDGCYGQFSVSLKLLGEHNVRNALAVIAATAEMGCSVEDIQEGLNQYQPLSNRGGMHRFDSLLLIDDTYNANPASMQAAFSTLGIQAKSERAKHSAVNVSVVLGGMAELGEQAAVLHQQVGAAASLVAKKLYCVGEYQQHYLSGFGSQGYGYEAVPAMVSALVQDLQASPEEFHLVLVKGSRSAGMEKVVEALVELQAQQSSDNAGGV